jgi:hypothetical protein
VSSSIYREVCHCGCDKLSHYRDPSSGKRFSCLNARCECKRYVDQRDPPPPPERKRRWGHPATCQCFDCKQLDEIPDDRPTDPNLFGLP